MSEAYDRARKQEYWESMGGEGPCPWNPEDYADSTHWRNRDPAQEISNRAPGVPNSPPIGYTGGQGALQEQIGGGHYPKDAIQPVEFIESNNIPFLEGCVIKRMVRHGNKNGVEDLDKAIHEIQLIKELRYNA